MTTRLQEKNLVGYRSRLTATAGETIDFMVHSDRGESFDADLVRIIHGETHAARGPGLVVEEWSAPFAGQYPGVRQDLRIGSFFRAEIPEAEPVEALTFVVAVFPTLFLERDQTVADLTRPDGSRLACLRLNAQARIELEVNGKRRALERSIPLHRWSLVGFSLDEGGAVLFQSPQSEGVSDPAASHVCDTRWDPGEVPAKHCTTLTLASVFEEPAAPEQTFNGRLESPRLVASALGPEESEAVFRARGPESVRVPVLGFWDFSDEMGGSTVRDLGPRKAHALLFNLPTRAVRGFCWSGEVHDWRQAPEEYGAIHFHEDDVYDMGWPASFSYEIPKDLRSGAYAARLQIGEEVEYVTFFVTPAPSREGKKPPIALILPTVSYLAYANERIYILGPQQLYDLTPPTFPEALFHEDRGAFGCSQYEVHPDGSGIHFSSWLRPTWNIGPNSRAWGFSADTNLIHWLETRGYEYDILTDHDLHARGAEAVEGYRVLMTGTHPEYCTSEMYDAYEGFLGTGGRLMYMGGNGFYWKSALGSDWPAATELRRAEDGTRSWASEPGEYHHALDGGLGGLWRRQGRAPNRLVGTGFVAQGFFRHKPYTRTDDGRDPRAEFIFEGVENEVFGNFGRRQRGAVGEEIDAYDTALGSPPHALTVATAKEFEADMILAKEEMLVHVPVENQPSIRADLVFFETAAGGAVLSVSSIAWSGSLEHQDYENDVARISENVLNRFIDPEPFVMPSLVDPEVPSVPSLRLDKARLKA
ncbi:MAG: hypothetical protein CMJ28_07420 [Phycisphaerae bacterium]|nr:hypothetical protein [Phycisphaerae bacterium]